MILLHRPPRAYSRAALAAIAVVSLGATAHAQSEGPSNTELEQMAELVRKAEARERENGHCATLAWPVRDSLDPFYAFLDEGRQGGIYLAKLQIGNIRGCSYYRMDATYTDQGRKCARPMGWACTEGAACAVSRAAWCRRSDGTWGPP